MLRSTHACIGILAAALVGCPSSTAEPPSAGKQADTKSGTTTEKRTPDWLQFRGPNGSGVSNEKGLPTSWSATKNINWKRKLPGPGASSPIVVGNRIYVTCYSGYGLSKESPGDMSNLKKHLVCIDRKSGRIVWDTKVRYDRRDHGYTGFMCLHGYASSTPVSDGKNIYAYFGNWGAYAFDKAGKQLWRFDCGSRTHGFGSGASPILHKNLLIVNASVESATIYAINKSTGKEVWKATGIRDAWNTPVIVKTGKHHELVVTVHGAVVGLDADNGKSLWRWKPESRATYVCPSLVAHQGIVYGMPTYGGPVAAIRAGGDGDVSKSHTSWTNRRFTTTVESPVYANGHLFYPHDNGNTLAVFDAKTGTEKKRVRFRPRSGTIYASPLVVGDKLYVVTRSEGTFVFSATPKLEQLAHNVIADDKSIFNGSPVPHDGQLLLRSDAYLYCIGKK